MAPKSTGPERGCVRRTSRSTAERKDGAGPTDGHYSLMSAMALRPGLRPQSRSDGRQHNSLARHCRSDVRSARNLAGGDGVARHPYHHAKRIRRRAVQAGGLCYPKTNFRTRSKKCLDRPNDVWYSSSHDASIIVSLRARRAATKGAAAFLAGVHRRDWRRRTSPETAREWENVRLCSLMFAYVRVI
jgi:hypothetical protein